MRRRSWMLLCCLAASACGAGADGGGTELGFTPVPDPTTPYVPTAAEEARYEEMIGDKLPEEDAEPVAALPAEDGPPGSLGGVALDDGTKIFIKGEIGDGETAFHGAVLLDSEGHIILDQTVIGGGGVRTTFPTGDAVEITPRGAGTQLVSFRLAATTPATVISGLVDAAGNVSIADRNAINLVPDERYFSDLVQAAGAGLIAVDGDDYARKDAEDVEKCKLFFEGLDIVADAFCAVWVPTGAASKTIGALCFAATRAIQIARERTPTQDPVADRAIQGINGGLSLGCMYLKRVIEASLGAAAATIDPVSAICYAKSAYGFAASFFEFSISDRICEAYGDESESLLDELIAGGEGQELLRSVTVGANESRELVITLTPGSGDADLYVRYGSAPVFRSFTDVDADCTSASRQAERCSFPTPAAGTWHIMVRGYEGFENHILAAELVD